MKLTMCMMFLHVCFCDLIEGGCRTPVLGVGQAACVLTDAFIPDAGF